MAECYTFEGSGGWPHSCPFVGEWLSLVEHLVRDQGVGGSNPLSPTKIFNVHAGSRWIRPGARFLGKRCATSLLPQVNFGRIETARQVQAGRGISSTLFRFRLTPDAIQAFHPEELARN